VGGGRVVKSVPEVVAIAVAEATALQGFRDRDLRFADPGLAR